jgi:hypothetical protein
MAGGLQHLKTLLFSLDYPEFFLILPEEQQLSDEN